MQTEFGVNHNNLNEGWIEVICGSMFSGKTEELIRRLKRARIANQKVRNFKPKFDTRYDKEKVVSHDDSVFDSHPVNEAEDILSLANHINVVGIDEAQFFDEKLPEVCTHLAVKGLRVIVAGLDMDYRGRPFGPMPQVLATAEYVTKLHAICMKCGNLANHSFRKTHHEDLFVLGEKGEYEPLCRKCFYELMREHSEEEPSSEQED